MAQVGIRFERSLRKPTPTHCVLEFLPLLLHVVVMSQDLCIECNEPVRPRQERLQCAGCGKWQHRTCDSGITQIVYRESLRSGHGIDWRCPFCTTVRLKTEDSMKDTVPVAESPRKEDVPEGK